MIGNPPAEDVAPSLYGGNTVSNLSDVLEGAATAFGASIGSELHAGLSDVASAFSTGAHQVMAAALSAKSDTHRMAQPRGHYGGRGAGTSLGRKHPSSTSSQQLHQHRPGVPANPTGHDAPLQQAGQPSQTWANYSAVRTVAEKELFTHLLPFCSSPNGVVNYTSMTKMWNPYVNVHLHTKANPLKPETVVKPKTDKQLQEYGEKIRKNLVHEQNTQWAAGMKRPASTLETTLLGPAHAPSGLQTSCDDDASLSRFLNEITSAAGAAYPNPAPHYQRQQTPWLTVSAAHQPVVHQAFTAPAQTLRPHAPRGTTASMLASGAQLENNPPRKKRGGVGVIKTCRVCRDHGIMGVPIKGHNCPYK